MTIEGQPPQQLPDPEEFIASYDPATPVGFDNGLQMSLKQALALEQRFCKADSDRRQDPAIRLRYLARRLGATSKLREEHSFLAELDITE